VSFNLFEEIERQNQEMLAVLHALHVATKALGAGDSRQSNPSAA
jgi:hypothetical protein